MKIITIPLFSLCLSIMCGSNPLNGGKASSTNLDQVRQTAMMDFSKTKLFKEDSVFDVTLYDTLHRMEPQRIDERNIKMVVGKPYPEIVAVEIIGCRSKFFLDTTERVELQNKTIPSRVFEKNGKLFVWWDKHCLLTDTTLKVLNKFHLLERGEKSDRYKVLSHYTDDLKKGAGYYFCRNNLLNYKRVITNVALGYYDPPSIRCK